MSDPLEPDPEEAATGPAVLLEAVVDVAKKLDDARRDLDEAVVAARAAGVPWAGIGKALGVSRQAAWERFHTPAAIKRKRVPRRPRSSG